MWLMLNDAFLSIVRKDCGRHELLVRARRKGDIEKIFPAARVQRSTTTDYLFRAVVTTAEVQAALIGEVGRINYGNFKDSVADRKLHDGYLRCWHALSDLQPTKPYSGLSRGQGSLDLYEADPAPYSGKVAAPGGKKKRRRGKPRRSIKRGR